MSLLSLKRFAIFASACVSILCLPPLLAEEPVPAAPETQPAVVVPIAPAVTVVPATNTADIRPLSRKENLSDYTLTWFDDFDGAKLDTAAWDCRGDTRFWSIQKTENVTVSDGFLHLALKKEKNGKTDYSSGGVISKRAFKYGYYEARIKCPPGKGWHTTFSLTAHKTEVVGARQEIDVFETDSIDLKMFSVNLQTWKPGHRVFGPKHVHTPDLSADFHVFGAEFTPQKVRFFFDGDHVGSMDANTFVHDEQNFWIGSFAAPLDKTFHVDDDKLPGEVLVDWVRFYEKKN